MAKNKNKKSTNKFNPKKALKITCIGTFNMIKGELEYVELDDLISSIYIKDADKNMEQLIKTYEKQLILFKINPEKFAEGLHEFFLNTEKYIRENKLFKTFFKLVNTTYLNLYAKNTDIRITNAYHDLLMQQYAYFAGGTKRVVYGVKTNGDILHMAEIGSYLSEINYELNTNCRSSEEANQIFAKYGYKINSFEDIQKIGVTDQILTNMFYQMSYYIDETNEDFIKKPFKNPIDLIKIDQVFYNSTDIDKIRDRLNRRQRLLPESGVLAEYANIGEIKQIYLTEQFIDNHIVLLYRVRFENGNYTVGFYDTVFKIFYSMWKEGNKEKLSQIPLENLALQTYMLYTCDLSESEKECIELVEVKDLESVNKYPAIKFVSYNSNTIKNGDKHNGKQFDKNQYKAEYRRIHADVRNLPLGAKASEEAKALAKNLGIELPPNKTFVKDFIKKVYVK